MKKILLIFAISFGLTQIIKAQNYTISSYIGDEDDYWSGGYIYDFLYLRVLEVNLFLLLIMTLIKTKTILDIHFN